MQFFLFWLEIIFLILTYEYMNFLIGTLAEIMSLKKLSEWCHLCLCFLQASLATQPQEAQPCVCQLQGTFLHLIISNLGYEQCQLMDSSGEISLKSDISVLKSLGVSGSVFCSSELALRSLCTFNFKG